MLEIAVKELLEDVTGLKITPVFGTGKAPFVTYKATPISGGAVKESQTEIKIISNDFDEALEIREKILKSFDMSDKAPSLVKHEIVLRSALAGGGYIFNDAIQMWEISIILIMKWRKK